MSSTSGAATTTNKQFEKMGYAGKGILKPKSMAKSMRSMAHKPKMTRNLKRGY